LVDFALRRLRKSDPNCPAAGEGIKISKKTSAAGHSLPA